MSEHMGIRQSKFRWPACKECSWPDKQFNSEKTCDNCFLKLVKLRNYYYDNIFKHTNICSDIARLITIFITYSKRKRSITQYDVVDPYRRVYDAVLIDIKYYDMREVGLFHYSNWNTSWDEYIHLNSPRILKHKSYTKRSRIGNGVTLKTSEPKYEAMIYEANHMLHLRKDND